MNALTEGLAHPSGNRGLGLLFVDRLSQVYMDKISSPYRKAQVEYSKFGENIQVRNSSILRRSYSVLFPYCRNHEKNALKRI